MSEIRPCGHHYVSAGDPHPFNLFPPPLTACRVNFETGEQIDATYDQLCQEVPDVTQALYEVCRAQGWAFIKDVPNIQPQDIVWLFELPYPVLQAA